MRRLASVVCVLIVLGGALAAASVAQASPVTLNFESGATLGAQVSNQYGPPATPAGPSFIKSGDAGFKGIECGPPHLTNTSKAHSGTQELRLDGCENGEFWRSDTFLSLGYASDRVEFFVASDTPGGSATVTTTAFNAKREIIVQQETVIPASTEPLYDPVMLESSSGEIAFVAIELGKNFGTEPNSSTGVSEGAADTDLLLDDLTYDPPASPPESSFLLGANPSALATAQGGQVEAKIPVTWSNNPDPSASPVQFEVTTPTGVEGHFSENPSTVGSSTLTLKVASGAKPGQTKVTVTGYVDKGKLSEKKATVEIPLGISSAIELLGTRSLTLAPCTPQTLHLRGLTPSYVKEPVTISVATFYQHAITIDSISGGEVISPHEAKVTMTPTPTVSGGEVATTVTLSVPGGTAPTPAGAYEVRAYSANYSGAFDVADLTIGAGEIDSVHFAASPVTPASVATPSLHSPGTRLTLAGAGFCPGSRVAIGDATEEPGTETQAEGESISPDGSTLSFQVPRGASTGAVKVLPPGGTAFEGPALAVTSFRDTFGFSWINKDYGLRMNDEIGDELFGQDETNVEPLPGWLVRKPEAVLFEDMTNKHIPGGICFGMAYSSLELHDSPAETTRFPHTGGTDPWHLDGSGEPSPALLRYVTERFSLQFTDQLIPAEVNTVLGIHGTNDDINEINQELAAGHPVILGLVHWNGPSIEGHSVLAYDSRPLPGGGEAVYLANSNVPYATGEEGNASVHNSAQFTRSELIIKDGNWEFPEGADFEGSEGKPWTGSEADLVVYKHSELPIIDGERPHLPNLLTSTVMAIFGSAGDGVTQLSDGHGSLFSNGALAPQASWPKGVAPLADFTSRRTGLQLVSFDPKVAGPLSATVARSAGGGAMNMNLPGLQASLQAGAQTGQIDRVTLDPRSDSLGYETSAAKTSLSGTLLSAPGAQAAAHAANPATSDRLVAFATSSSKGATNTFSFAHGGAFVIAHTGRGANISLTLSAFAPDGRPLAVVIPAQRLAAGEKLSVTAANWRALGSTTITLRAEAHGKSITRRLRGRLLARAFAHVRTAKLTPLGHGRYAVDLLLSGSHASPRETVSVAASLIVHGRTIARTAPNRAVPKDGRLRLTLPGKLARGHYLLRLRLLETTGEGAVQGSAVVSTTVHGQVR